MKVSKSKLKFITLMIPLVVLLSGCGGQVSTEASGLWNWFVIIFAKMIVFFGNIAGSSLGMGIIIMTIFVRVVMVPLYGKQIKSSEKIKLIQPKIDKINKKYEGKKSPENDRKKAMETQALYKAEGINPLAGCLPLLIQFPLLIAFYDAIQYLVPAQSTVKALQEQGETVIYGLNELGANNLSTTFLGFELNNPVFLFAVLAAATTYLTTYVSIMGQDPNAPGANVARSMMYIMPLMILFFGLALPGALSIYWVVGNIISVLQTLYFKRSALQTQRQKNKLQK